MHKLSATFVLLLSLSYGSLKYIDRSSGVGIYGGSEVAIKDVPFMAIACRRPSDDSIVCSCGGAIVGEQHVLTAAHCCKHEHTVSLVKVGTDRFSEGGQLFDVEKATIHPNYNQSGYDNDICVLKLQKKLSFSKTVDKIPMADKDFELNEGDLLETIGFGLTENGTDSEKLLKVSVPYIPKEKCSKLWPSAEAITETMLCAGGLKGKGVCNGDSGSPMFYNKTLVALTSFGPVSCNQSILPAVFARISTLRPFIDKVINDGF